MAKKIKLMHLLVGLALVGVGEARAYTCKAVTTETSIPVPDVTIQRDLPVGSQIGTRSQTGIVSSYECSGTDITYQEVGLKAYGSYVTNIDGKRVYATGIAGIGYAVGVQVTGCGAFGAISWVKPGGSTTGNPNDDIACAVSGRISEQPLKGIFHVAFYKTAEIIGSGEIPSQTIGAFILRINKKSWIAPESKVSISSFRVNSLSCSLSTPSINVDMGKVSKGLFGGEGTWPGDGNTRDFSIPLECSAGTNVNLKIEGNVHDAMQGVLALDAGGSSASGVGIQLLYGDNPVELGKRFKVGTASAQGRYNIPLKARYLQTGSTITSGAANGSATILLTYL